MSRDSNRDQYDRPSWSEIDKKREGRSGGGGKPEAKPNQGRPLNRYQQKKADQRFDSLFSNPDLDAALETLRKAVGKENFAEVFDAFHSEFGFPTGYDLLQVALEEHPSLEVQVEALGRMDEAVDEQAASTQQVFKSRVKLLRMTARDATLKKAAARIAKRRGL